MITRLKPFLRRLRRDEGGTTFVFAALASMMIVGFGAVTVDLGNAYRVQRQLQSSADAAALAGAMTLYTGGSSSGNATTAQNTATSWSASSGDLNALTNVTVNTTSTSVSCTGGTGATCTSNSTSPNGMKVTETASVPTFFGPLLGIKTLSVSATSYAIGISGSGSGCSGCGGLAASADVMILVDSTESMQDAASTSSDPECSGYTNVGCAMYGVQQLLADLTPAAGTSTGATVGLMTFPGLKSLTDASYEYCAGNTTTGKDKTSSSNIAQYSATNSSPYYSTTSGSGPYYLIYPTFSTGTGSAGTAGLAAGSGLDGTFASAQGTLTTTDDLVLASGYNSLCQTQAASKTALANYGLMAYGGAGTSLSIAMTEATNILQTDGRSGAAKYLVILSDGDANSSASMPSNWSITDPTTNTSYTAGHDECHQAIAAAHIAQGDSITVVTLGYGEETSNANGNPAGCNTDTGAANLITPCQAMTQMASIGTGTASAPQFFYSDTNGSGNNPCPSTANTSFTSVNDMFKSLANVINGGSSSSTSSGGSLPHLLPAT